MTSHHNQDHEHHHHHHHEAIVLFYKYFVPSECPSLLKDHSEYFVEKLHEFQKDLCSRLELKGRILLSGEGINGTLSGRNQESIQKYMDAMKRFDVHKDIPLPETYSVISEEEEEELDDNGSSSSKARLFETVDWKQSSVQEGIIQQQQGQQGQQQEPFPDLKISIVKEIVSTGGLVNVEEIPKSTGKHLSPQEFHNALMEQNGDGKEVVLIDVRNTFEHDIGHFVIPKTGKPAMNPEMVTFSSFDSNFCAKNAETLKDKKVLMYCTGGIRCEKASVMLKKRGVEDVSQLSGGIHRYLEEFGNDGCYKGLNFVFDQRVAMKPSPTEPQNVIVGKCIECETPFDEICGSRVCAVCRDLVLVCPSCQTSLREYHCRRHSTWKDCYFTFLEPFDVEELDGQKRRLVEIHAAIPTGKHKNMRRTLSRQIDKISKHILKLKSGEIVVHKDAPRRCRTCMEPNSICDGLCWGFWKTKAAAARKGAKRRAESSITKEGNDDDGEDSSLQILPIAVGDFVEPGGHWNILRLGEKTDEAGSLRKGKVVEVKCWAGDEKDCVAVVWDGITTRGRNQDKPGQPQIYRWGVLALDGTRMYDVQKV